MENTHICNICENSTNEENLIDIGGEELVCQDCFSDNYVYCDNCGDIIERDSAIYNDYGTPFCEECYYNRYTHCANCENEIEFDNANYDDNDDCYYCDDCYADLQNDDENIIKGYHCRDLDISFKSVENDNLNWFLGFELEVENKEEEIENYEMANSIRKNHRELGICFERDGSLSSGFEIISQPMTYNYIKAHKNEFSDILESLRNNGFASHDTTTCGLHIHISKTAFGDTKEKQDKNISKLLLFVETFKEEIKTFSRRTRYNYCKFESDLDNYIVSGVDKKYFKSTKVLKEINSRSGERYQVINNLNTNTLEIRVFKGTLKFETFMATIEFVYNLVKCITEKETRKISFNKVINYTETEYLKSYCDSKYIYNSAYLNDETSSIEKEVSKKLEKYNNNIKAYNIKVDETLKDIVDITDNIKIKDNMKKEDKSIIHIIIALLNVINEITNSNYTELSTDNHDLIDLIRGSYGDNSSNLLSSYSRIIRELRRINDLYENDKTKDIIKEYIGKFEENYRNLENEIRQNNNNDNVGGEE